MFINRISEDFEKATRKIVVQSLVLSVMNYCINICGSCNKTNLLIVCRSYKILPQKLYIIGGARKYDHVTPLRKKLK